MKLLGMFAFQDNSFTRSAEYPWAFTATKLKKRMKVVEIGGGLSGFQFVLSKSGMRVSNVDPGEEKYGWGYSSKQIDLMNRAFDSDVTYIPKTLDQAGIAPNSIDRVYCISVIEHLSPMEQKQIMKHAYKILKKGGYFILTVDLFLDIYPFTQKQTNKWGSNASIKELISGTRFKLHIGHKNELTGFTEFDEKKILENLSSYLLGTDYPVLTQAFVLKK